jgi:hypothetical protein
MMPVDNSVRASVLPDHIVGSELVHVHLHHISVTSRGSRRGPAAEHLQVVFGLVRYVVRCYYEDG